MSTTDAYDEGELVACQVTFTNTASGAAVDPTTVTIKVRDPNGTLTTYTYAGDTITKVAVGVYKVEVPASIPGTWYYRAESTGSQSAKEAQFFVRPSKF
jgi:hypothetical protein